MNIAKFTQLLSLAAIVGGMLSCSGDEDPVDPSATIVGSWTLTNSEVRLNNLEIDAFSQDFAGRVNQQSGQNVDWQVLSDNFNQAFAPLLMANGSTLQFNADNSYTDSDGLTGTWQLAGNQLTVTDQNGTEMFTVSALTNGALQLIYTEEESTDNTVFSAYYETLKTDLIFDFQRVP